MTRCLFPSTCPHEAVLTARIHRVGDRPLCQRHFDWLVSQMGEDCRALATNALQAMPAWRQRGLARDLTGSLR